MEYDLPESGVHTVYFPVEPERKIVKAQCELKGKNATFRVVTNINYAGETYYEDSITLKDNDSIYATKGELVVLRGDAQPEFNLDGQYIHIAEYVDGVVLLFVSKEPWR